MIVIRAHVDKRIHIGNLHVMMRRRDLHAATFEYDHECAKRQVYAWDEPGFPSADSTTHVRLVVDEQQKVLRDVRLHSFCALDEAAPIKTRGSKRGSSMNSFTSMASSRRLHPMPTATEPLMAENTVLEQFSALLRNEGVYLDRRAPLVRLGSHVNLLAAASSTHVSGMMGSSQRRRSAVVVERASNK